MSNFGFGMHPNNNGGNGDDNGRDDDDHNDGQNGGEGRGGQGDGRGNNPFEFLFGGPGGSGGSDQSNPFGGSFGGGNLGDLLNQFGSMFSGFGADLNSQGADDAVNYSMVERTARQHIRSKQQAGQGGQHPFGGLFFGFGAGPQRGSESSAPSQSDSQAVAESVRLAELWLDGVTTLPAGATGSVAFGPEQWLEETLETWKRIFTPLAEKLGEAAMGEIPEEMRDQMGPLAGVMRQVNAMNFSMQLGHTLGELATGVSHSTQWGMPLAGGNVAAVATAQLESMAEKLGTDKREALIYLATREAAHHRLFKHVPWLAERLILDVEEFARGLALDTSAMEEAMREFNPESMNDPAKMQEMMAQMQGQDLSPKVVSANAHARERLETSLSLVEGWVDYVVGQALADRMPNASILTAAWSSYRNTESPEMEALSKTVGISLLAPRANDAAGLWHKLDEAVGAEKRDGIWDHPDLLPTAKDLDNPAGFIGKVAFDGEDEDFDPISEIEKLEAELNRQGGPREERTNRRRPEQDEKRDQTPESKDDEDDAGKSDGDDNGDDNGNGER